MRWANGGGWTTEIIAFPHPDAWDWRLSVAEVAGDGPFSVFPDVDRTIALLTGVGFALTIDGTSERVIDEPFQPVRFDGAAVTTCRLIDGPIQDVNLMVRRGTPPLRMRFLTLEPSSPRVIKSPIVLVVAGTVTSGVDRLARLDVLQSDDVTVDCAASNGRVAIVASISEPTR